MAELDFSGQLAFDEDEPQAAAPTDKSEALDFSSQLAFDEGDAAPNARSAFPRGLSVGTFTENPKLLAKGLEGFSYLTDDPEWKARFQEGSKSAERLAGKPTKDYELRAKSLKESIGSFEDFGTWIGEASGQAAATTLPIAGAGAAGAAAGFASGGPFGAALGGIGAAGLAGYGMNFSDAYQSIEQELIKYAQEDRPKVAGQAYMPEDVMQALQPDWTMREQDEIRAKAAEWAKWAAIPMTLLDVGSLGNVILKFGTEPAKKAIKDNVIKHLIKQGTKAGVQSMGVEAGTEVLQTAIPQLVTSIKEDKPFWTEDHAWSWAEAGLAAGPLGGVGAIGGATSAVREKMQQPKGLTVVPPPPPPGTIIVPPTSAPTGSPTAYPKGGKGGKKAAGAAAEVVTSGVTSEEGAALSASMPQTIPQEAEVPTQEPQQEVSEDSALDEEFDDNGDPIRSAPSESVYTQAQPQETAPSSNLGKPASPRILKDETAQKAVAAQTAETLDENLAASKPKVVKPKHRGPDEIAKRQHENTVATAVVPQFAPDPSEDNYWSTDETKAKVARGNLRARARKMLAAAKAKGLSNIPQVFAENTDPEMNRNDQLMLLSEAARLARHKSPGAEDFARFWQRDRIIRSGDEAAIAELRAARKSEADAAMRVGSKGEVEHIAATPQAWTEEEAAIREQKGEEAAAVSEASSVEEPTPDLPAAPDTVTVKDKATGKAKKVIADAKLAAASNKSLALTAQDADMADREASVSASAKGPARTALPMTKRAVRQADGKVIEEEVAAAPTGDLMTPERKAKMIAEMNAKGVPPRSKPKEEVTSEVSPAEHPKVAEIKAKAAAAKKARKPKGSKVEEIKAKAAAKTEEKAAAPKKSNKQKLSEAVSAILKLPIKLKTLPDEVRTGVDKAGKAWSVMMHYAYGEIARTVGNDGDPIDVTLGGREPGKDGWFIIDQIDADTQKVDEHKTFTGFANAAAATEAYMASFSDNKGPQRFGGISHMSDEEFKSWLEQAPKSETVAEPTIEPAPQLRHAPDVEAMTDAEFEKFLDDKWERSGTKRAVDRLKAIGLEAFLKEVGETYSVRDALNKFVRTVMPKTKRRDATGVFQRTLLPMLLDRVSNLVPNVPIYIVRGIPASITLKGNRGVWDGKGNYIVVDGTLPPAQLAHTILHEAVHAAFAKATWQSTQLRKDLTALADFVKDALTAKEFDEYSYSFYDVDEFIAEAISNAGFQAVLANIPLSPELRKRFDGSTARNAWDVFIQAIGKALGIARVHHSALAAFMRGAADLETTAKDGLVGPWSPVDIARRRHELRTSPPGLWQHADNLRSGLFHRAVPGRRVEQELSEQIWGPNPQVDSWTKLDGGTDVAAVDKTLTERMNAVKRREGETNTEYLNRVALKRTDFKTAADKILPHLKGRPRAVFLAFTARLGRWVNDLPVVIIPQEAFYGFGGNANTAGMWLGGENTILLSSTSLSSAKLAHHLLHEGVHAAFLRATNARPDIERIIDQIAREAQAAGLSGTQYGFANVDEFIAEVFSNPDFIEALSKIKASPRLAMNAAAHRMSPTAKKFISLWDKVIDAIADALGITGRLEYNLLEVVMQLGAELESDITRTGIPTTSNYSEAVERHVGMALAEGSPWWAPTEKELAHVALRQRARAMDDARNNIYTADPSPAIEIEDFKADVAARTGWATNLLERGWVKFATFKQMARWYRETLFGSALQEMVAAISAQQPHMDRFRKEYAVIAQEFIDWARQNVKEAIEFAAIGLEVSYLEGNVVDGETGATILAHPSNEHYGKNVARHWQGKARLPALQERYNKLSPKARQLWQKMVKFYSDSHNKTVTETVKAFLETAEIDMSKFAPGLANRVMDRTMTDADKAVLGSTLYHALHREASFHKVKGAYFPSYRYGDWVVETKDTIKDTMGGTQTAEDKVLFTGASKDKARKLAEAFVKASPLRMSNIVNTYYDANTGKKVTADQATGLNDVIYGAEVTMQTRGVYFFESEVEARKFAKNNPEGHDSIPSGVQQRLGAGYQAHILSGTQMATIMASIDQRLSGEANEGKRLLLRSVLTQSAARMAQGNRITSRRLKRQKITGASTDFGRSILQYGEAAGKHITTARAAPQIRAAMDKIRALMRGYEGKDKPQLALLFTEIEARIAMGTMAPNEASHYVKNVMTLSYFARLGSIAYSLVNATQVPMLAAPMLDGKFGGFRGTYALAQAYADMGFTDNIFAGVGNTLKALNPQNFNKAGIASLVNLSGDVRAKLAKAPDGAALVKLFDAAIEDNAISETAGFEIEGAVAEGKTKAGRVMAHFDRAVRQLPASVEIMNRTVTAVAAYRLAIQAKMTEEKALQFALDMVDETQFDYSNPNQPRFMNKALLRPAMQFKKYAQGVTYLLASLTARSMGKDATGTLSKADQRVAQAQLARLMAMQVLVAGTVGLPAMEFLKAGFMIASLMGLGEGWEEQEDKLRALAEWAMGKTMGEIASTGIPAYLGLNLSSRVGMGDVWLFGEPKKPESDHVWAYIAKLATGSPGALIGEAWEAVPLIMEGEYLKATAKLFPLKTARDSAKAAMRYLEGKATEGEAIANIIGFQTGEQAREGREMGKSIRRGQQMEYTRKRLDKLYRNAKTLGERAKIRAQIIEHNKKAGFKQQVFWKSIDKYRGRE